MNQKEFDVLLGAAKMICGYLEKTALVSGCRRFLREHMPVDGISLGFIGLENETILQMIDIIAPDQPRQTRGVCLGKEAIKIVFSLDDAYPAIIRSRPDRNDPVNELFLQAAPQPGCSGMVMKIKADKNITGIVFIFSKAGYRYTFQDAEIFFLCSRLLDFTNPGPGPGPVFGCTLVPEEKKFFSDLDIIGKNTGLKPVMERVRQVAGFNSPVLLLGETGSGKEVIANAIHYRSPRADCPFIKVNCGAIPEDLVDSELFGHERGSFTGAICRKKGKFEQADTGTLFLDEVGELSLPVQVRLLRAIQTGEIFRVGSEHSVRVDIRIICATHRDLRQMLAKGAFRDDLWFRLAVFPIHIPPLRHRPQDIEALTRYFVRKMALEMNLDHIPEISPTGLARLLGKPWPGNVRELKNIVERTLIRHGRDSDRNTALDFDVPPLTDAPLSQDSAAQIFKDQGLKSLDHVMAGHIRNVLCHTRGRIEGPKGAAAILALHPSTLRSRMKKLGIPSFHN